MTTTPGGGTADLVAELRAQAEAAVARAAETKEQVAREVVEVRAQATAVAAAVEAGARQAAETTAEAGQRLDEAALAEARAQAASAIAEAEAKAASIRVAAAEGADEATAALARAEVRRESAAVQADALRLTARREAAMHRRQQLDETHEVAHGRLDAASDMVARLGVALEDLSTTLAAIAPASAELRTEIGASGHAVPASGTGRDEAATDEADPGSSSPEATPQGRSSAAAERLRRVRNR